MKKSFYPLVIAPIFISLSAFSLALPPCAAAQPVSGYKVDCKASAEAYKLQGIPCSCQNGVVVCPPPSKKQSPGKTLSTNQQIKQQVFGAALGSVLTSSFAEDEAKKKEGAYQQAVLQQAAAEKAAALAAQQAEEKAARNAATQADIKKMMQSLKSLDGSQGMSFKSASDSDLGFKPVDSKPTAFFGIPAAVPPGNDPNVVDLTGKKGIVDPNNPGLGGGGWPNPKNWGATKPEVREAIIINSLNDRAKRLGWSEEKRKRLDKALLNLNLSPQDFWPATDKQIRDIWDAIESRSPDKTLARDIARGKGPKLPVGAGEQTANDCPIFTLANAARLPYSVVAAQANEVVRDAGYRSAAERANPQKAIEDPKRGGLNGGELVMLTETFGRVDVVRPGAFAGTLAKGKPVMIMTGYPTRDPDQAKAQTAGHDVVLTKTFVHNGQRWYEMMNSQQSPWKRQYLNETELMTILEANGVVYSPPPRTVVKSLK